MIWLFLICLALFIITLLMLLVTLRPARRRLRRPDRPEPERPAPAVAAPGPVARPERPPPRLPSEPQPEPPPPTAAEEKLPENAGELAELLRERGQAELETVYFHPSSDRLREDSAPALRMIAQVLLEEPGLRLRVEGGSNNNINLAFRRARSIVRYLTGKHDISAARLEAEGRVSPHGRNVAAAKNRRAALFRLN